MSTSQDPHPDPKELSNLAQERLGKKKTRRILEHCKECPQCADFLLEAVRSQPLVGDRPRLSKWNWISIFVLALSLISVVVALFWFLNSISRAGPPGS